jgi:hypothetical protein
MTLETIRNIFAWCLVMNFAVLILWLLIFLIAQDWIYKIHGQLFKIPRETFNAVHYKSLGYFKMIVFVFNLVPYIAMHIVG